MAPTITTARSRSAAHPETSARSDIYEQIAAMWEFPDETLCHTLRPGPLLDQLQAKIASLPYRLRTSDLNWTIPTTDEELQSEYIRLFQIGTRRGPPCPLHSGFYSRDRSRTLQKLIRFYNFFGFGLAEQVMPDQIGVELEFMSRLARGGFADRESLLRAQRDFLKGELAWIRSLQERLRKCRPAPFYASLTALSVRLIDADQQFIEESLHRGGDHGRD